MLRKFTLLFCFLLFTGHAFAVLSVSFYSTQSTCNASNGTLAANPTGGVPPYWVVWSTGATTSYIDNLAPGVYTATVTDSNGDTASGTIGVTSSPNLLHADLTFVVPGQPGPGGQVTLPCKGQCDGIAYLADGTIGTPPYMLSVLSGNPNLQVGMVQGVPAIMNICTGDPFQILVTDATGCSSTPVGSWIASSQPSSFNYQETVTPACFGTASGAVKLKFMANYFNAPIEISGSGITTAFTADSVTINHLLPGVYNLLVSYSTLAAGCDTNIVVTIPDLGPNCGVISGKVFLDTIANCSIDVNEPSVPQQLIRFDPGPYFATSDAAGNYSAALPYGTYSATLIPQYQIHPVCNATGLVLSAVNDTIANVDLGDSINIATDLAAGVTTSAFRPGFSGYIYPTIHNTSMDLVPYPSVDIYYDPVLTYVSSPSYTPSVNVPGHLQFMTNAIPAFSSQSFYIQFQVPANVNLLGTTLTFTLTAHANVPEPDTTNNSDTTHVVITGSFDPNDKAVEPSRDPDNHFFLDLDDEFNYKIRFQNTGTDTTFNAVIIDTLDAYLDPSTVHIIANSHPMTWEVTGQNVLKFYFNNILLPDSNTNEAASHGAVEFGIKPVSTIPGQNEIIYNRADIYFDFNPPVLTNTVSSIVTISVGVPSVSGRNVIRFIPNPADDKLNLQCPSGFELMTLQMFSLTGQEVLRIERTEVNRDGQIDISLLKPGYYLVKVQSVTGELITGGCVVRH